MERVEAMSLQYNISPNRRGVRRGGSQTEQSIDVSLRGSALTGKDGAKSDERSCAQTARLREVLSSAEKRRAGGHSLSSERRPVDGGCAQRHPESGGPHGVQRNDRGSRSARSRPSQVNGHYQRV